MNALRHRMLWAVPVLTAAGASWVVYHFWRMPLPAMPTPPVPVKAVSAAPKLSPQVVARLFDLPSDTPLARAQTALKLKASVVAGGSSRILVEHAGRVQAYRVGDRLPDGSDVRQISALGAVLWQRGEETFLPLRQSSPGRAYLEAVHEQPAANTRRYLRAAPTAGPHA